jgi:hypothetical protein
MNPTQDSQFVDFINELLNRKIEPLKTPNNMIKSVERKSVNTSVMTHITHRVEHKFFTIDIEMMCMFYRNDEGDWVFDTCDPTNLKNLVIGDIITDDSKIIDEYFNVMKSMGHDWENECYDFLDNIFSGYSQKDILDLILMNKK